MMIVSVRWGVGRDCYTIRKHCFLSCVESPRVYLRGTLLSQEVVVAL